MFRAVLFSDCLVFCVGLSDDGSWGQSGAQQWGASGVSG